MEIDIDNDLFSVLLTCSNRQPLVWKAKSMSNTEMTVTVYSDLNGRNKDTFHMHMKMSFSYFR